MTVPRPQVHVVTGFLGSGKTTLLRALLASPRLAGTAVLVNEVGEIGLDHLLLETVSEDVLLLRSGCACCTIRGDLKDGVLRLLERQRAGLVPRFARLVIETSGLAEPGPIVATFAADPLLRHQLAMGAVVTVVDAVGGEANLDRFAEARTQVAVADRILVSKADLAAPGALAALTRRLGTLNPAAPIASARPPGRLIEDLLTFVPEARLAPLQPHDHRHTAIRTLSLEIEEPLDWAAFALWLGMLLNRHGGSVLRVKGVLRVIGATTPVVVHGVQHTIHEPVHLAAWPDGREVSRLVMILRDLDPAVVERSLRAFTGLATTADRTRAVA